MAKLYVPHAYQTLMFDHLMQHKRCALFAGMGLGKTVTMLTALDALHLSGEETKPALVTAPLRVAQSTWPDEAAKWEHLRHMVISPIVGTVEERRAAMRREAQAYTVNYDNIPWLLSELEGKKFPYGRVIADESTRLKGFRTRQGGARAAALGKIAHVEPTGWTNLTGLAAPNGIKDLWGPTWFLDAGARLGRTHDSFKRRWFKPKWGAASHFTMEPLDHAQAEITEKISDICAAFDAKDYFPVEEPLRTNVYIELPAKARQLYTEMEKRLYMEIDGWEVEAFNQASKTLKLLQLASGAIYVGEQDESNKAFAEVHDLKLQALESVIENASGASILVSYHFKSDLCRLKRAFPRGRTLDDDPRTIRDWNAGKIEVMFAHPASAGHGLNLQDGGNIIVHFSHWWDLETFAQINERIGPVRQKQAGHNRCVFEVYLIAKDTADEDVMARRAGKISVQEALMQGLKRRVKS
jgi:SNF2 family DNA or RNA helicase